MRWTPREGSSSLEENRTAEAISTYIREKETYRRGRLSLAVTLTRLLACLSGIR